MIHTRLCFAWVVAASLADAASALTQPQFVGLGDLPGGLTHSLGYGISADGSTVVGVSYSAAGAEAFRWNAVDGMQGLGDLPGGNFDSQALAASRDGAVVVGKSLSGFVWEAFAWTGATGMQGLGDLADGGTTSYAQGISDDGATIVGRGTSFGHYEAFRWTASGGMQGLGFLPGTDQSEAFDASADGSVVVGQSGYPFIWDAVTGMRSLGTLPGSTGGGEAYAVSADGSHVVGLARRFGFVDSEAFLWTESTGLQGLGDLPGSYAYSESRGVSADGRIVVGRSESDEGLEAFIWDPVNGMQELDEYLIGLGLDLTGWHLDAAWGVSDDGLAITGWGTRSSGVEAWYAVIPEPATGLLVGAGLAALAARRRRSRRPT